MFEYILNEINKTLQKHYYDSLIKNKELINKNDNFFFKFEYFLYLKFYIMYLFFYHFKRKHTITFSFLLNLQYLVGELCMKNQNHYQLIQENNIAFLDKASHYIFISLFLLELYFNNHIFMINKFFIMNGVIFFKLGNIIKKLFIKRDKCIQNNIEFHDPFEFLFILPKLEDINHVIVKTKHFNDINLYFFINILLILLS